MALFNKKPKPHKIGSVDELRPMIQSGKPVLIDFMQVGCRPCQVMDGIVNELARDYGETAHIVKVDVAKVAGAAQMFNVRSTPTFVLLGRAPQKKSKKAARKAKSSSPPAAGKVGARWRTTGLVKKDQLERVLESNGATKAS
jgi:thiol-disulfide isomerase/thioredoxin